MRSWRGEERTGYVAGSGATIEGYVFLAQKRAELLDMELAVSDLVATTKDAAVRILELLRDHRSLCTTAKAFLAPSDPVLGLKAARLSNRLIAADLTELARTPVAVVSAGCKAILDIPRTLEVLETFGVPVVGFGCDEVPAFYTRDSGCPAPLRLDTAEQVAALLDVQWSLGLRTGVLVTNPIPEAYAMDRGEIDGAIAAALAEAETRGVTGKAVTPFLLARVAALTGERSLHSNIALVKDNARVAAEIAAALAALERARA